jgi:hypothetical protein
MEVVIYIKSTVISAQILSSGETVRIAKHRFSEHHRDATKVSVQKDETIQVVNTSVYQDKLKKT